MTPQQEQLRTAIAACIGFWLVEVYIAISHMLIACFLTGIWLIGGLYGWWLALYLVVSLASDVIEYRWHTRTRRT